MGVLQHDAQGPQTIVIRATRIERTLWTSTQEFSAASGGTLQMALVAGSDFGGDVYFVLGSFSGTTPGLPIDGFTLPLNTVDPYFNLMFNQPNSGPFGSTLGFLDPLGRGTATVTLPPAAGVPFIGKTVHHAWAAIDPLTFAVTLTSNAEPVTVVP